MISLGLADLLIFALYAITTVLLLTWARRSGRAAEVSAEAAARSAAAADRSAGAAERSADAAERSADAAEKQIQIDRDAKLEESHRERLRAQPILVRDASGGKVDAYRWFDIKNVGARVANVQLLSVEGELKVGFHKQPLLEQDSRIRVDVKNPKPGWFEVGYTDLGQNQGSVWVYTDGSSIVKARSAGEPILPQSRLEEWVSK